MMRDPLKVSDDGLTKERAGSQSIINQRPSVQALLALRGIDEQLTAVESFARFKDRGCDKGLQAHQISKQYRVKSNNSSTLVPFNTPYLIRESKSGLYTSTDVAKNASGWYRRLD